MFHLEHSGAFLVAFCALVVQASPAAVVPTVFNTGVVANDANGKPTSVILDNEPDPHYQLVAVPTGDTDPATPTQAIVAMQGQFPFSGGVAVWAPDTATSKWIAPHGNENRSEGLGSGYDYRTTFDLTGFNPATAQIQGTFYADDALNGLEINGLLTSISGGTYATGTGFTISSGFLPGINTLDFLVVNNYAPASDPSGFRVEMTAMASTPEPTGLVVAIGLCGMGLIGRRRLAGKSGTRP